MTRAHLQLKEYFKDEEEDKEEEMEEVRAR